MCLGLKEGLGVGREAADDRTLFASSFSVTCLGGIKRISYIEGSESLLFRHMVFDIGEPCKSVLKSVKKIVEVIRVPSYNTMNGSCLFYIKAVDLFNWNAG